MRTCAVACVFGRVLGSLRLAARVAADACEWACVRALRHGDVTSEAPGNSHCFAIARVCHHLRGYVNEALLLWLRARGGVLVELLVAWLRACSTDWSCVLKGLRVWVYVFACARVCMCVRVSLFVPVRGRLSFCMLACLTC